MTCPRDVVECQCISRLNNKKRYNKHLILFRMHFLLTFLSFFFFFSFFVFFFRSNSLSEVLKYTRCLEIHTFSRSKGGFRPEILTEALSCHDMYILVVQQCFVGQSDDTIENSSTRICILWTAYSVTEEKLQFRKWDFVM